VQVRHTTVARISLRQRESSTYIGIPSVELCEQIYPLARIIHEGECGPRFVVESGYWSGSWG